MLKPCFSDKQIEAGCDEAGRGCLAGPVFAAAVILDRNFRNEQLNDSKKLTEKKREELRIIIEEQALAWAVATVSPEEIDDINILNASYLAMHRAIDQLKIKPELLLIDGNRFNTYKKIPHKCIVKGDGKYMAIAAASILAKTHRDAYMLRIHQEFPGFGWNTNKGYPTRQHKLAIYEYGLTPYHRKSFNFHLQLKIDF
ncbi:MAG: ribonuclease HII [Bacteroidetes bacterium]|nr:MAG: ribonuclease HII [Bacteroidota bacterium]